MPPEMIPPSNLSLTSNVVTKRAINRTRTTSTSEKDSNVHIRGSKTIYTAGRPPWYDSSGQMKEPLVIGMLQLIQIGASNPDVTGWLLLRIVRWERVRQDHRCQKDHWGAQCSMGFVAQHGLVLQGSWSSYPQHKLNFIRKKEQT